MATLTFESVLPATLPPVAITGGSVGGGQRRSTPDSRGLAPLDPSHPKAATTLGSRPRDQVAAFIQAALSAIEPSRRPTERRRETRQPYPYPIHLTPLSDDGQPDVDRTFVVIGKHLAPHGLDFYSRHPLSHKRVIASLDCGKGGWIGLVVDLTWCRFGRHGWYDNGGRFIAVTASPLLRLNDREPAA